jgi:16S rRNA (cytidine1402-2'-O)-methyltransferase
MPTLYIVATPIGNLEDITFRALRVLKESEVIICEDTRRTSKLLQHYQIEKRLLSYHQQSHRGKIEEIISLLSAEKNLALVTDSGTPGISDPGNYLISEVLKADVSDLQIIPIPGPSALIALASVSGMPMDQFLFLGFIPHKKGRQKILQIIVDSSFPVIFYESPYRILKTLHQLEGMLGIERRIVVGRELTKFYETVYRGTVTEVLKNIEGNVVKGEFSVIVEGKSE